MIKNLLFVALAACVASSVQAASVTLGYTDFDDVNLTCTINQVSGSYDVAEVVIPDEVENVNRQKYKVTKIADYAICDLPNVTTVTIGKYVSEIGRLIVTSDRTNHGDTRNFLGCPKLTRFQVAPGCENFSATGAGILMAKGFLSIVKVPQMLAVTDGVYKMSTSTRSVCDGAFAENSTIVDMYLSPS